MKEKINTYYKILDKLENKISESNYLGWDPFDGLNSKYFNLVPFSSSRIFRLIFLQLNKKSPINLRKLLLNPQSFNSKAGALFISGYINLLNDKNKESYLDKVYKIADKIIQQNSNNNRTYFCAGYNFDWEAKAFSVTSLVPNIIVSTFVGNAFLDLYEYDNDEKWLRYVIDIGKFIESELVIFDSSNSMCFGYVPNENIIVHNANLMGAKLFSRLYTITEKSYYKEFAYKSTNYSIAEQLKNGSWRYGKSSYHDWIDNFHTGFNLVSIKNIQDNIQTNIWDDKLNIGYAFHKRNHFTDQMIPKYYNNSLYPIDIHNFAQAIDTFLSFKELDLAEKMVMNSIEMLWNKTDHYFFYQKKRFFINKINYIRWSQSWMFYAISKFLSITNKNRKHND